jgi:hypothetical protein
MQPGVNFRVTDKSKLVGVKELPHLQSCHSAIVGEGRPFARSGRLEST